MVLKFVNKESGYMPLSWRLCLHELVQIIYGYFNHVAQTAWVTDPLSSRESESGVGQDPHQVPGASPGEPLCFFTRVRMCCLLLLEGGEFTCLLRVLSGHRGEGAQVQHGVHRQAEISGPRWHHSGPVPDDHQEAHPAAAREGPVHDDWLSGANLQVCVWLGSLT